MSPTATKVPGEVLPVSATGLGSCHGITWFSRRHPNHAAAGSKVVHMSEPTGMLRTLAPHEVLFKEGDVRSHVYELSRERYVSTSLTGMGSALSSSLRFLVTWSALAI